MKSKSFPGFQLKNNFHATTLGTRQRNSLKNLIFYNGKCRDEDEHKNKNTNQEMTTMTPKQQKKGKTTMKRTLNLMQKHRQFICIFFNFF